MQEIDNYIDQQYQIYLKTYDTSTLFSDLIKGVKSNKKSD